MDRDALIADCRSGDPKRQIDALIALETDPDPAVTRAKLALLGSPEVSVRLAAVESLCAKTTHDATEICGAVSALLADNEPLVRNAAAEGLGALRCNSHASQLGEALLSDASALVRASAAEALGEIGDVQQQKALVGGLSDADAAVRGYCANALGLIGAVNAVPSLEARLHVEESLSTQVEIWAALARLTRDASKFIEHLRTLANIDEYGNNIANVLEDYFCRHTPAMTPEQLASFREILATLARQSPMDRAQFDRTRERISSEDK
jgi:HEAT repeat protein